MSIYFSVRIKERANLTAGVSLSDELSITSLGTLLFFC